MTTDIRKLLEKKYTLRNTQHSLNSSGYSSVENIFSTIDVDSEEMTWDRLVKSEQLEDPQWRSNLYCSELWIGQAVYPRDCIYHSFVEKPIDGKVKLTAKYHSYFDIRVHNATYARICFGNNPPYDFVSLGNGEFTLQEFTKTNHLLSSYLYSAVIETDGVVQCNGSYLSQDMRKQLRDLINDYYWFPFRGHAIFYGWSHNYIIAGLNDISEFKGDV